ncbi:MAG: acetoin utilization protein AcuC [Sedimentitalea sp.]
MSTPARVTPDWPHFIAASIYRGSSFGATHPLAIERVPTVVDLCRAMGWLPRAQYRTSPRAKPKALAAFHTPTYIAALQQAEMTQSVTPEVRARHHIGTVSNPVYPEMFRRPATSAGGSIYGAELIAKGGTVYHPAGGTHHGLADRANGFCFFNDPVLAIMALHRQGLNRVAYVDIDAHHCDGVEAAFGADPRVRLISVHEENRWPRTGALTDRAGGSAWNLPVPRGLNDSEFALILNSVILPVLADFRPDALVVQCGADALAEDPLARLELSNNAHFTAIAHLHKMAPRVLVLGGGGYNPWSVARAWSGVWATLCGHAIPEVLPEAAQTVLGRIQWHKLRGAAPPAHWVTTLRDAPRPGPIRDAVRDRVQVLVQRQSSDA